MISPGNPFIFGSKVKVTTQKQCRHGLCTPVRVASSMISRGIDFQQIVYSQKLLLPDRVAQWLMHSGTITSNNFYAHDEQGVNPGQVRGFDGVLSKL